MTFLATLLWVALSVQTPTPPVRPDIVVFVIDDVADSDIDAIQAKGWCTNLTQMASQGVRYRRFYAHPQCAITRDSLYFSRWLGLFRGDACAPPVTGLSHATGDFSLPELFDGAGYHTLHDGKWHIGVQFVGGFEMSPSLLFDDVRQTVPIGPVCSSLSPGSTQFRINDGSGAIFSSDNTLALRDAFIAWWAATPAPRFAIVEFGAAHEPFKYPPAELLPPGYPACGLTSCTNRKEYEAEIVGVDTALGQMRAVMGPAAYSVFLGDNGTPGIVNGEPASKTVATRPDQDPLRVKLSAYEDGVRVPLIIAGPKIAPAESDALAHVVDLLPTLARMASIKPDPDALIHGRSFAGTLIGLPGTRTHVFVWNPLRLDSALIERRFKLLTDEQGVEHLYDLEADPDELIDLPLSGPDYDRLVARRASILAGNP